MDSIESQCRLLLFAGSCAPVNLITSGGIPNTDRQFQSREKRQRTAALQNLAETRCGSNFAKRLGVRLSSAAFCGTSYSSSHLHLYSGLGEVHEISQSPWHQHGHGYAVSRVFARQIG